MRKTTLTVVILCALTTAIYGDQLGVQEQRWGLARTQSAKVHFVEATAATIRRNQSRYEVVEKATGVPWQIVGAIHTMECGGNFRLGLYCGDPLTARTKHVPKGRPVTGNPPFDWAFCAIDAIRLDKLDREPWARIGNVLQNVEAYNGTGYQKFHPEVPTPYLWSFTTIYVRGKYIEDGRWSSTAISQQCGVAPILRNLLK